MSTGGAGGHSPALREDRISANRSCGGGSWVETPALWGAGDLREMTATKEGGESGREESERGKLSFVGEVLGREGWCAVTVRVEKVREVVSGVMV